MTEYPPGTPSWVDLGTSDVDAAAAFYGALFGWEVADQGAEAGHYALASLGGRQVAGLGPQTNPGPPMWTTYVSVADCDATVATAKAAGATFFVEPMDVLDAGRIAVLADPTGAVVALCWNELATGDEQTAITFYERLFAWTATTRDRGGEVLMEPMTIPAGKIAVVRDPQGAVFGIVELSEAGRARGART